MDIFIVKYDKSGNVLWAKNPKSNGVAMINDIDNDSNGNVYVTGYFKGTTIIFDSDTLISTAANYPNFFVVKYDGTGKVLWAKNPDGGAWNSGSGICTDTDDNIYVTGSFRAATITFGNTTLYNTTYGTSEDIFIVKYDASGNVLWAVKAGGTDDDWSNAISSDVNGNIYITGFFNSYSLSFGSTVLTNTSPSSSDVFTVKYDSSGTVLWAKSVDGSNHTYTGIEIANDIAVDAIGNAYVTGYYYSSEITFDSITLTNTTDTAFDIFVVKYDKNGNTVFAKNIGGADDENAISIYVDDNDYVYIAGYFASSSIDFGSNTLTNAGEADLFIAKLDNVTGIIEGLQTTDNKLIIYPNPAIDKIYLKNIFSFPATIEFYDIIGKKIISQTIKSNNTEIDINALQKGLYLYKIYTKDREYMSGKMIVR